MKLFEGVTETRRTELMAQLRAEWSHDSTAIEGNTLSLGETMFVLEYGLTVKGKPIGASACKHPGFVRRPSADCHSLRRARGILEDP